MSRRHGARAGTLLALALGLLAGCRESGASPQAVPGGDPARGRRLVAEYGCGGCHVVPGVPGAVGGVGPSLAGFAERSFIVGGLRNEPEALVRWILAPQSVEPATVMPTLGVAEPHARDIAAYLYTLSRGGLGPPHLFPADAIPAH